MQRNKKKKKNKTKQNKKPREVIKITKYSDFPEN